MKRILSLRLIWLPLLCSMFLVSCLHNTDTDMSLSDLNKIKYGEEYNNSILKSKNHIDSLLLKDNNDNIKLFTCSFDWYFPNKGTSSL